MYYALTINPNNIISGVHESMTQITDSTFQANNELADDAVVVLSFSAEYETGQHILCYNEDGTRKPDLWCITNGYMELPPNKEIINGELVDKEMPIEAQPQTLKEYLNEQFGEMQNATEATVAEVRQEAETRVIAMRPLMTELVKDKPADIVINSREFVLPWIEGKYLLGDVRMWDGQPRRCCQAHDSAGNPTWTPAVASLWSPYHGTTKATALRWVAPTGAQDMYTVGEHMVFRDITYRCKQDTVHSPEAYAQAWEVAA